MIRRLAAPLSLALAALLAPRAAHAQEAGDEPAIAEDGAEAEKEDPKDTSPKDDPKDRSKDDYRIAANGHRYRVRFDPASRVSLTSGLAVLHDHLLGVPVDHVAA